MNATEDGIYGTQPDQMEPLPLYTEEETSLDGLQALMAALSQPSCSLHSPINTFIQNQQKLQDGLKEVRSPEPIMEYPEVAFPQHDNETTQIRQNIVVRFFEAISKGQGDIIALFINNNLVTANTINRMKETPLLAAVTTKNLGIVQELLEFGADPNAFGVEPCERDDRPQRYNPQRDTEIKRTPLQLAASIGHLPIVKLLMEAYNADDSLIAPDGQIALRLAAENGHREVVDYLPARRGGGFRRWQHHHQKAIRRAKKALKSIYGFGKFFVWDVEKFFLWTVPQHLVFKPLSNGCIWCWKNKHFFLPWLSSQIRQIPDQVKWFGKGVWKGIRRSPKVVVDSAKAIWKFGTTTLPSWFKKLAMSFWNLLTTRIPNAIAIAAKWIFAGFLSTSKVVLDAFLKILSLLHTVFEAVLTFFRDLTLRDVWNGFWRFVHTIFVSFPKALWSWALQFSKASFKFMKVAFGDLGEITWWAAYGIGWLVMYLPRKALVILQSLGGSFSKGWYEVVVLVRPKS